MKINYFLVVILLLIISCHSPKTKMIIGVWRYETLCGKDVEETRKNHTFNLKEDGTLEIVKNSSVEKGQWKYDEINNSLILLDADGKDQKVMPILLLSDEIMIVRRREKDECKISLKKVK